MRIVFICENNQYAQSTKLLDVSKTSVAEKARGFGINSFEIDGLNISNVKDVSFKIINDVREKGLPALIQSNTYRFHRHFVSERAKEIDYLDFELHNESLSKDPLIQYCMENNLDFNLLNT